MLSDKPVYESRLDGYYSWFLMPQLVRILTILDDKLVYEHSKFYTLGKVKLVINRKDIESVSVGKDWSVGSFGIYQKLVIKTKNGSKYIINAVYTDVAKKIEEILRN